MVYVQFYQYDLAGNLTEPCGSDSVFILDGRNSLYTQIKDGHERAYRLRKVAKFEGFKIMHGSKVSNGQPLTGFIKIGQSIYIEG